MVSLMPRSDKRSGESFLLELLLCPVAEGLLNFFQCAIAGGSGGGEVTFDQVGLAEEVELDLGFGA